MTPHPSIAVVGTGAVGGYYGARLAQHGHDLHFLLRSDYDAWRSAGLSVQSIHGDFALPAERLHVYSHSAAMPKVDLVIVALKTTQNHQLQELIAPLLHKDSAILTLQNGLGNEQALADLFGASRVIGGIAFTCINRVGGGQICHSDYGLIRLGEFRGAGRSARTETIARIFADSRIDVEITDDLHLARWDKQVWNVPFNGLGALLDATTDQLIGSQDGTNLVLAIMDEVLRAAAADGARIDPQSPQRKLELTRTMGAYRTSTQIDRHSGRPMEIDAIFARPVEAAHKAGIALPLLEMLLFSLRLLNRPDVR